MGLTLNQLLTTPSKEAVRTQLLGALQGRGYIRRQVGACAGSVSLESSGTPTGDFACQLRISTAGDVGGSVEVEVSTDGGATWASPVVPTPDGNDGLVTIGATGITARMVNGPSGTPADTSFSQDAVFAFDLQVPVLPVSAWQPGSTPLTLLELFAQALTDAKEAIYGVAAGSLIPYSYGAWLDLLAEGTYNLTRRPAATAQHQVQIQPGAGAGPYVVPAGQLVVQTADGLRFSNVAQVTIPLATNTNVTVQAEGPGAKYNVGVGAIRVLVTSLPGCRAINLDIGDGTSILSAGADQESDADLQARCQARWPALGIGGTAQSYDLLAREASNQVTRTVVSADGTTPGQVNVLLAGTAGPVDSDVVLAVQLYLNSRVPLCVVASVASAVGQAVNFVGTIYVQRAKRATAQPAIIERLRALVGGTPIAGTIYLSQIVDACQGVPGVRNVTITTPNADVVLASNKVATMGTITGLTFVEV